MPTFAPDEHPSKHRRLVLPLTITLLGALLLAGLGALLGVGRWLVVEDPLEHTQSIAVMSGSVPMRALEAARLYRAGYATQVWLTRPAEPGASLQAIHIAYIGEDFYNIRVLMQEGVPENAIRVLEPPIANTADETRAIATELRRQNSSKVILITSKAHTRRVRALWDKLSGPGLHAVVRPAHDDPFQAGRWWRTSSDALDVVREVLGMLNVWAGLPLEPSK